MVRVLPYRCLLPVVRRAALLALAACALPAAAQSVVKCLDAAGNVTYQNAPCDKGQAARPIEMPKAESRDDTSAWEAAASEARVVVGMPKRWVLRSRGAPAEIRRGGPREGASEVWRYGGAEGGGLLVGFRGEEVVWVRGDARPAAPGSPAPGSSAAPATPAGTAPAATPATSPAATATAATATAAPASGGATRGPQNRRFVIAGRYCEHVFAEIGAADRDEPLAAAGQAAAGRRYWYEPAPGDASMRTVFSCIDGKVADVERTLVRP